MLSAVFQLFNEAFRAKWHAEFKDEARRITIIWSAIRLETCLNLPQRSIQRPQK
jgi:hypothetical protein